MSAGSYYDQMEQAAMNEEHIDIDQVDTTPAASAAPAVSTNPSYARNIEDGQAASQKQIDFITKLSNERDVTTENSVGRRAIVRGRELWRTGLLGKHQASGVIDDLLKATKIRMPEMYSSVEPEDSAHAYELADERKIAESRKPEANTVHMYDGEVYRVRESKVGRLYAEKLHGTSWKYAPGQIRFLSPETVMTADQAAEYGKAFGVCAICGRTLTNEDSIARGIGPVCASRL